MLTAPNPRRTRNQSSRGAFHSRLASGDSGLQLNLEIAQAVSQRRSRPLNRFSVGRKCVEASDNVINYDFTDVTNSSTLDLSPMPFGGHQAVYERRGVRSPPAQGSSRHRSDFQCAPIRSAVVRRTNASD